MTRIQRINNVVLGLFLILLAAILALVPEEGCLLVLGFVGVGWLLRAISLLVYYFTMARFMVGGKRVLLKGVIFLDLAMVVVSLDDIPRMIIMIYLVIGMIFVNVVEIIRAFDAKKCKAHWKFKMIAGLAGIILAIICLVNYKSVTLASYIYAVELVHSALVRITNSFKRTKIVYIQ